jgi:hypothetical protein
MSEREFAALLRSKRTLSQAEVDKRTARHDKDDLPAQERRAAYGS